jgi:hypothetical protein
MCTKWKTFVYAKGNHLVSLVISLTQRSNSEMNLNLMSSKVFAGMKSKTDFQHMMHHKLRTMMNFNTLLSFRLNHYFYTASS